MKKIQFTFEDDTLKIRYKIEENTFKNLNNTNIISKDDVVFDIKYLKNNLKIVAGFLNVISSNDNVKKAIVEDEELICMSVELLNYIPSITELVIKPDVSINYDMHMAFLKNDTLKKIECYYIPSYLLERIDTTKTLKVSTRAEVFFVSNFLKKNDLHSYSDVFYKRKIMIDYDFGEFDYQDFDQFLLINTYLKTIQLEIVNMDLIKTIMKYLREHDKKNIEINIKGNKENLNHFDELESYSKKSKFMKKNKIRFKIDYTREYKFENFIKLLNFTTVKYILVGVIISCICGYGINQYDIYKSSEDIDSINESLSSLLEEYEYLDNSLAPEIDPNDIPEEPPANNDNNNNNNNNNNKKPNYVSPYYKNYAKVISVLKETNPDTVGWLTVNNTTVNYPVVQSTNNSYYLNHDFNRNSNSLGWVFMDYRNNPTELDQNTVIYGHNVSATAKIMFGNLAATLNEKWYKNPDNQYITFNTAQGDMQWRIFSIYKVATTNDYLYSTFDTQEDYLAFIDKMKSRSIYDFGVEILPNSKIVTLSTCQNSGRNRLVVHAVLVE